MKILSIILTLVLFSTSCFAKIIPVGKSATYTKIQDAINAAQNGDIIEVEAGVYKEKNIVINKSITLKGINYPVLDGEHLYEIISVKSNHVIIQGFKLVHTGVSSIQDIAAIKIYSCNNVSVIDNILMDTFFGVYLQNSSQCSIKDNKLIADA
ncbi:MAG: nitrous oxide reductase family maturation protein NosD, partial [Bacteroidetes bacterium]|nr:nitrous oxide reductase family maturation protein NosD [Bacteroidota bacterium]